MKQYGKVMDRMQQDPSCKQDVLAKAGRTRIAVSRRSIITGTAVAAALLVLNVGVGGYFLNRAAEDSIAAVSETAEVTELIAETTAAAVSTEQTVTVTAAKTQKSDGKQKVTGTNAKTQKSDGKQTITEAAAQTAAQTVTEAAVQRQNTAATTVTTKAQPKQTTTSAAVTPQKKGKLTYSLIPADKPYETNGENQKAPVVCHVKPGEQVKMQLTVQNDPGVTEFYVPFNISKFDYLSVTGSPYYRISTSSQGLLEAVGDDNRGLYISGNGTGGVRPSDHAVLAECTLIAPSNPGHYLIREQDSNNQRGIAFDVRQSPVFCDVFGIEVIVDADEAAESTAQMLADPEQMDGLTVYIEPVIAHAGQKNVPVNVCIKGADPYVSGGLMLGYDPALKSLLFDRGRMEDTGKTEFDKIGVSVDGTLLEHAPLINSTVSFDESILVFFNNYFARSADGTEMIYNGASESDALIREDGVLLRLCFDVPEECGHYRIFAYYANLSGESGGNPEDAPVQHSDNFIPGEITVIP